MMKNFGRTDKRGSTLLSVMVVTAILSLFLLTLQPIMFRYAQRSLDERDLKQAELSARSANNTVAKAIMDGNAVLINGIKSIASDGASLPLDNFTFSQSDMGTVEAKIKRISTEKYQIITRASVNASQRTIVRELDRTLSAGGGPSTTPIPVFYLHTIDVSNSSNQITTTGNKPIVVADFFSLRGGNFSFSGDLYLFGADNSMGGNARLNISGKLYTNTGSFTLAGSSRITLPSGTYNKSINSSNCPDIFTVPAATRNLYNSIPDWVRSTGTTYSSTATLNGGTYHVVSGTSTIANITGQLAADVTPQNPVYIIVRTGTVLTLSNPIDPPVGGVVKNPRIVFLLEGTAQLHLQHTSSAVVYGTSGTSLVLTNPAGGTSTFHGQVRIGTITNFSGGTILLDYRAATGGGQTVETWVPGKYIKGSY